jgi:hypothetical protein
VFGHALAFTNRLGEIVGPIVVDPEGAGSDPDGTAQMLGVDAERTGRSDHEMIDIAPFAPKLEIMEDGTWVVVFDTIASATIAVSHDEGATWSLNYASALPIGVDRPWLASYEDALYMSYADVMAVAPGLGIFATSTDHGRTWSHTPYAIFEDLDKDVSFTPVYIPLTEGFTEKDLKLALFSEHHLFKRLHKKVQQRKFSKEQAMTMQEITRLQPGDAVSDLVQRRQDEDRQILALPPQLLDDRNAVEVGHRHVEHHHVRRLLLDVLKGRLTAGHGGHDEALEGEGALEGCADRLVVVDDEDVGKTRAHELSVVSLQWLLTTRKSALTSPSS